MPSFLVAIVGLFGCLIIVTLLGFVRFGRRILRYRAPHALDSQLTEAAVILSLRGGDASLRKVLNCLVDQKYPRYRIYIVIDHPHDPAAKVVQHWRKSSTGVPVQVEFLRERLPYCTLKFSAIRQVLDQLPPEIGAVAIVDGDADPYANWLRDLIAPMAVDESVAAVSGNRWYFPRGHDFGGWCRFIFNGCSLPFMEASDHTWGGSLALRRNFADSPEFREAFTAARVPTEEQAVFRASLKTGRKVVVSPHVMIWNRDRTAVPDCFQYVFRQLFWSRRYYPLWDSILGYGVVASVASAVSLYGGLVSLRAGTSEPMWNAVFAVGLLYLAVVVGCLAWIHRLLRLHVMPRQGRIMPPLDLKRLATLAASAPAALFVYTAAAVKARLARSVEWRGIRYDVIPPHAVRLAAYRPLADTVTPPEKVPARLSAARTA